MPQMAPLMWNMIFLTTSLILLVTLAKTFFTLGKKETEASSKEIKETNILNKTWMW